MLLIAGLPQRWISAAVIALVGTFTPGCTGNGSASGVGTASGADLATSPVFELLGLDRSVDELRALDLERENEVAKCMKAAGWEYTPVDHSSVIKSPLPDADAGYGIAWAYAQYQGPDASKASSATFSDPNKAYVAALDDVERAAYYQSLAGIQSEDGTSSGCLATATYTVSPVYRPEIQSRLNELLAHMKADARFVDAEDVWAGCMQRRGYDFAVQTDAAVSIERRLAELQGLEIHETSGSTTRSGSDDSNDALGLVDPGFTTAGVPKILSRGDITNLRKEELQTYDDDVACQEQVGFSRTRNAVLGELVRQLKAEFPVLRASTKPAA